MTDKEIMERFEALEPYVFETAPAIVMELETAREIHDLIVRQTAQLRKEENKNSKLRNERNRLRKEKDNLIRTYKECMVEAIKEFAERLKDKFKLPEYDRFVVSTEGIEIVVKEMTEVKDDE